MPKYDEGGRNPLKPRNYLSLLSSKFVLKSCLGLTFCSRSLSVRPSCFPFRSIWHYASVPVLCICLANRGETSQNVASRRSHKLYNEPKQRTVTNQSSCRWTKWKWAVSGELWWTNGMWWNCYILLWSIHNCFQIFSNCFPRLDRGHAEHATLRGDPKPWTAASASRMHWAKLKRAVCSCDAEVWTPTEVWTCHVQCWGVQPESQWKQHNLILFNPLHGEHVLQ